jgi:hypothetical protein
MSADGSGRPVSENRGAIGSKQRIQAGAKNLLCFLQEKNGDFCRMEIKPFCLLKQAGAD